MFTTVILDESGLRELEASAGGHRMQDGGRGKEGIMEELFLLLLVERGARIRVGGMEGDLRSSHWLRGDHKPDGIEAANDRKNDIHTCKNHYNYFYKSFSSLISSLDY